MNRKPLTIEGAERRGASDARRGWTPSVLRWEADKGVTTNAKLAAYWRGYSRECGQ